MLIIAEHCCQKICHTTSLAFLWSKCDLPNNDRIYTQNTPKIHFEKMETLAGRHWEMKISEEKAKYLTRASHLECHSTSPKPLLISQLLIWHHSSKYVFFQVNACPEEKQTRSSVWTVLFLFLSSASHPQSSASPPEAIGSSGSPPSSW